MATEILMPALSPTMEEGKLAKWLVKEGDEVHSGDILAEIETDKATMEFEAVDEGRIDKILIPEGTEGVKVNQPIALLVGEGDSASNVDIASAMQSIKQAISEEAKDAPSKAPAPKPSQGNGKIDASHPDANAAQAAPVAPDTMPSEKPRPPKDPAGGRRVFASPLARRLAERAGLDIVALAGSGPRGRIVKADVEAAEKSGGSGAQSAPQRAAADGVPLRDRGAA
jgi:pyruvate dehydrogenase E2 component (dihydrolipoamide acetyltransferase)